MSKTNDMHRQLITSEKIYYFNSSIFGFASRNIDRLVERPGLLKVFQEIYKKNIHRTKNHYKKLGN